MPKVGCRPVVVIIQEMPNRSEDRREDNLSRVRLVIIPLLNSSFLPSRRVRELKAQRGLQEEIESVQVAARIGECRTAAMNGTSPQTLHYYLELRGVEDDWYLTRSETSFRSLAPMQPTIRHLNKQ